MVGKSNRRELNVGVMWGRFKVLRLKSSDSRIDPGLAEWLVLGVSLADRWKTEFMWAASPMNVFQAEGYSGNIPDTSNSMTSLLSTWCFSKTSQLNDCACESGILIKKILNIRLTWGVSCRRRVMELFASPVVSLDKFLVHRCRKFGFWCKSRNMIG